MPELPEVETIRRGFQRYIVGKKVEKVEVKLPKVVTEGRLEDLVGVKVERARRYGKVLVLDFNSGLSLLAHVKLTGQFIFGEALPNQWTHIIFYFTDGSKLYYNDIRQFGWLRVIPTDQVESFKFINELGPEPVLDSNQSKSKYKRELTFERFQKILESRKTKIKPLLLDQTLIGGVGNIYSNDALFLAGIDPQRPANGLSLREQSKLYEALLEVLKRGLKYGGASEYTYVNILGEPGKYQEHFLVYGKTGKPCKRCGTLIKRISLAGRGTFFCEQCQH